MHVPFLKTPLARALPFKAPLSSVITLLLCNVLAVSAHAQQAAEPPSQVKQEIHAKKPEPQRVEVQARSEAQLSRQDAAAKTIISTADLVKFGDTNVLDAMRRVPGVQVNNNKIQLLGMNANYTQVLIDGEPPRGVNVEDIPMQMIERIEIYRTANAQFSTQAVAGTVNIILKRTASTAQQSVKVTVGHVQREQGSVEWNKSGKQGNFSHSVAVTAGLNSAGANIPRYTRTEQTGLDSNGQDLSYGTVTERRMRDRDIRISPRLQYKTDSNINLTSTTMFAYASGEADSTKDYLFSKTKLFNIAKIRYHDTNERANLNSTIRATTTLGNDWKLDISGGLHANRMNNFQNSQNFKTGNGNSDDLGFVRNYDTDVRVLGAHTSGKVSVPTNTEHDLVMGWTGAGTTVHIDRNQTDIFPGNAQPTYLPQSARNELYKSALYAQDEWKFQKNSSIYLGLRWESLSINSEGSEQEKSKYTTSVLSPIVQTLWQLDPQNTERIRLGLARTYQAPNDFYLVSPKIYSVNNSHQNPNFIGNPKLRPELAWGLDAAFEHNGKDGLNYAARAKIQQVNDLIRDIVYSENNSLWKKYINIGSAVGKSLELSTQFPLKRFVNEAPDLDVSMTYMHFWSNVKGLPQPFNQLNPYTYQFTLNLNYRLKDLPLTMGMNAKLQDSHWQQTNLTDREYIKSPSTLDLFGLWKFDKQNQLRLAINNITNSKTTDSISQSNYELNHRVNNDTLRTNVDRARNVSLSFEHKF
ncbi:TonB-dependent receptor plug domain-containing protein [Undibacterium flavidum]|uniref:TonB-dependent receptor n=1 Tax=Undibacterium flavidum TaxID=2762297 RepID=A0ABR6Y7V3_9BURK|nr:TonB-dependent receptor [Undibacterium flavidum]MBC3872682.1 TonB-dependent receptor [Undibacterium flavidum]